MNSYVIDVMDNLFLGWGPNKKFVMAIMLLLLHEQSCIKIHSMLTFKVCLLLCSGIYIPMLLYSYVQEYSVSYC